LIGAEAGPAARGASAGQVVTAAVIGMPATRCAGEGSVPLTERGYEERRRRNGRPEGPSCGRSACLAYDPLTGVLDQRLNSAV